MRNSAAVFCAFWLAAPALAQDPLSAIDWLNDPVSQPSSPSPATNEPPVADAVDVPDVAQEPLGTQSIAAVGLLPPSVTGLPTNLWQNSQSATLIRAIEDSEAAVPAVASLLTTLLLAEAEPPRGDGDGAAFVAARVARLMEMGAIDPALALLERAGPDHPDLFTPWLEASLLEGRLEAPCEALNADPWLTEDIASDIFCAAREGDWSKASLTFGTAAALGTLPPRDRDLLERFLDPEISEGLPPLPPPSRPTPLQFALFEAIGEALPTGPLPRAFAYTDLSGDTGWRAQIAAAERLARSGALPENRLLGIYTLRSPAASGGIWDRVEAMQRFDIAMTSRNPTSIASALTRVWPQMEEAELLVPFAALYADQLLALPLSGRARDLAIEAGFLSEHYERAARQVGEATGDHAFLAAIARGEAPEATSALPHADAIAAAFGDAEPTAAISRRLGNDQLGEAILRAIDLFSTGAEGNSPQLSEALASFRAVGLEDTARRAALQLALLDRMRAGR
ncbi:hypothetical protein [Roseivivax sp. THAF30]|uniref:hypothetical protein n=1 Tax=Roseivivax sp. THAF30 TaxID=2587852 RepID=UPI00126834C5|nr:hypothetical protein [Roseivivax sp. THAF30]QFT62894.1 hypothetical protein FIU91_08175 [Roseivivax sp. THAF30]